MFCCIAISHFVYPFLSRWTFGLFPPFSLLWIMLLWNFLFKILCEHVLLILLGCLYGHSYQLQIFCCVGRLLICLKIFHPSFSTFLYTIVPELPWPLLLLSWFRGTLVEDLGWEEGEASEFSLALLCIILSKVRLACLSQQVCLVVLVAFICVSQLLLCLVSSFC